MINNQIKELITEIKELNQLNNPVEVAWKKSIDLLNLEDKKEWKEFVKFFLEMDDLIKSDNAYHNEYHTAEAIISSAYLVLNEFDNVKDINTYGPILITSMLFHDIGHTGKNNTIDYELEEVAINKLKNYVNESKEFISYWNNSLGKKYENWEDFQEKLEQIILETDFKNGPKKNVDLYDIGTNLDKLRMLANEADIMASCLEELGYERGQRLSKEQSNPGVGSLIGREFFLKNLAKYKSKASKKLQIQDHIDEQLIILKGINCKVVDGKENKEYVLNKDKINIKRLKIKQEIIKKDKNKI